MVCEILGENSQVLCYTVFCLIRCSLQLYIDPNDPAACDLYEKLTSEVEDRCAIHVAMLQNLEPETARYLPGFQKGEPTREYLLKVISIAQKTIDEVNQVELLTFIGTKSDTQTDVSSKDKWYVPDHFTHMPQILIGNESFSKFSVQLTCLRVSN